ncbi:MAG TPA: tetratricopeptide repeat-containing sensor histidine kinase [Puia sp.]|nr:tetratricopeptide repeat-containing sensor histidine kinase [Puia sp.]
MKGLCFMYWLGFVLLITPGRPLAQSLEINRLRGLVLSQLGKKGPLPDTGTINNLNLLAHTFYGINADSAFFYGKLALDYAQKAQYGKGQSDSWRLIGNEYKLTGDYTNMLSCYYQALLIAEKINDSTLIGKADMNIAIFYGEAGKYEEALTSLQAAARIFQGTGDSLQLINVLSNIADNWYRQQQYGKALEYNRQALQIARALKNDYSAAFLNNDIGKTLAIKGLYTEALTHHLPSLDYYRQTGDQLGITETTAFLANVYLSLKNYPAALRYARQSLELATAIKAKKQIKEAGRVMADCYEAKGDYRSALSYFKLYRDYSDSVFNEETRKKTFELGARYEYERKEALMKEAAAKKDALQQHVDRYHTLQIFIAALIILFLTIVAFVLLRSRKSNRRNNQLLQAKNQEISRQKEEMEHQAVQLLLNNQQKDKLFSIIAHDLRGPLNSLKGLIDLLKEKSLSESEINAMMAELRRNVDHSSELVGNLLFWASSQLNGIVVTPVRLPVQQLVTDILPLYVRQAAEKALFLKNEILDDLIGYADKDMMQVILRNLISNAIKFCRPGDTITIRGQLKDSFIEICVADTGIGIKEEMLNKIRRKESISTYGTAKEKGTGLGMLLCREFTEENKGRFWIESEWGKGSCFYFTIPAAASSSSINV